MELRQTVRLLTRLSSRNVWLYKSKSATIGGLLLFGTFLIVFGLTLLRNIETSMQESITKSVAADIQVYSAKAKDKLALFGSTFMGTEDLGRIENFKPLKEALLQQPAVSRVIPMGMDFAILGRGNELDDAFDAVRAALKSGESKDIDESVENARHQISIVEEELKELSKVMSDKADSEDKLKLISKCKEDSFWNGLKTSPEQTMQFLETKIAPLSGEKQPIYFRYLGTDVDLYPKVFKKFKIVEGTTLPTGTRGTLISRKFREDFLKNIAARGFDRLHKKIVEGHNTIAGDAETKRLAADLARQHMAILVYLSSNETRELNAELSAHLKSTGRTEELVKSFLAVDDANFLDRYDWFYKHIAPRIKLYEISTGDTIVARSYTRSGYIKSVPLKVWGVYTFEGLEDSDLAGGYNIIDLVSFRELYGEMDEASKKELQALKEQANIRQVSADSIEDDLFGSSANIESTAKENTTTELFSKQKIERAAALEQTFDPSESERGLVLNAGILLKEGYTIDRALPELSSYLKDKGFDLNVVDWKEASGFVGQFVGIVRLVLLIGVAIIFLVALVIINNSMIIATLDRTREIGTIRAIGGQKLFVVLLFLWETFIIGILGAVSGTVLAAIVLLYCKSHGIPAAHDVVVFLFSGPRLYPHLYASILTAAPFIVVLLAVGSCLFAARYAAQISPAVAMQEKE